jgi:hypothetical protein
VPAANRVKRRSDAGSSKELKEAREQASRDSRDIESYRQFAFGHDASVRSDRDQCKQLTGGFSAAVFRFVADVGYLGAFTPIGPAADETWKATFPRRLSDFLPFEWVRNGEPAQVADTSRS